jgi:hypothetical protein
MKINITSKIYNKPPINPHNYDWEKVGTLNARTDPPNQIRQFGKSDTAGKIKLYITN